MTSRVVLTEKPSVARDIAQVIARTGEPMQNKGTYIEGDGQDGHHYCITWCFGHLLELYAEAAQGGWKLENLPLIPEKFDLKPIPDRKPKSAGQQSDIEKRLSVIKMLFQRCDEIVVATDAGREGQAIFENVYTYLGVRKPVLRLWTSSLTEDAIREGFSTLKSNISPEYSNLAKAAWQRSVADWLVGVNATRAFTLLSGYDKVLSLGRVQTPTLCMICKRYEENKYFVSQPYWYLEGHSVKDGIEFRWRGEERYNVESLGIADRDAVMEVGTITVMSVKTERKNEQPPLLHDIASLQKIANSRYSLSMEDTQDAAQSLYEKKLISYPRTGSRYIPEDVFAKIPSLLRTLTEHPNYGKVASSLLGSEKLNRRSVDNDKITDHHALIITGNKPKDSLSEIEQKVYDLVLMRFLEAFSPACIADVTNAQFQSAGVKFSTKGRKEVFSGWRSIGKLGEFVGVEMKDVDSVELDSRPLPHMEEGETIGIASLRLIEDKTKPQPLYTDATLLTAMETAGRNSDDKQIQEALKDIGIGTPATRSEIKKTLLARHYIETKGKYLIPTDTGLMVYHAIREEDIANVELTARWEIGLDRIAKAELDDEIFGKRIREFTRRTTKELWESKGIKDVRASIIASRLKCPKCGKEIRLGEKSAWCPSCKYTIWRHVGAKAPYGKTLSDSAMRQLITKRETTVLSGFKKADGTEYSASVELLEDGSTNLVYQKKFDKK